MADEVIKRDANRVTVGGGVGNDSDLEIIQDRHDTTSKRKLVDALSEQIGHSAVSDGTRTVSSAGTRVQLSATSVACKRVFIQALDTNTGVIVVGSVTCVAAAATRRGLALYGSQGQWFNVDNLNLLYLDATVGGEKVHYMYET